MVKSQTILESKSLAKDATYYNAKTDAIHRWFPYLEGFSETFIENIVSSVDTNISSVFEPFSGSGTVPVYCKRHGLDCYYSEVNPFLHSLTDIKLKIFELNEIEKVNLKNKILKFTNGLEKALKKTTESKALKDSYTNVFKNSIYFEDDNFSEVLKSHNLIKKIKDEDLKDIVSISICNSLLPCSLLKRMGDVRFKKGKEKNNIPKFLPILKNKLLAIAEDLLSLPPIDSENEMLGFNNAKTFFPEIPNNIDVVITSPPYLNGTNYIRNTKLELWYMGFLLEKSDLAKYRKEVVTSGINDVTKQVKEIEVPRVAHLIKDKSLWYDQRIPQMINDYFYDMKLVIENIYKYLKKDGVVFFDIGDSIYANQHIPTDLILCDLFVDSGFTLIENIKLRDRRSKSGKMVKQCLLILKK